MPDDQVTLLAIQALDRYEAGGVLFSSFVLRLEHAVDFAEESRDARGRDLRRLWGELEILNAVALDQGSEADASQTGRSKIAELLVRIRGKLVP